MMCDFSTSGNKVIQGDTIKRLTLYNEMYDNKLYFYLKHYIVFFVKLGLLSRKCLLKPFYYRLNVYVYYNITTLVSCLIK